MPGEVSKPLSEEEASMASDPEVIGIAMAMAEKWARRWGCDPDTLRSDAAYRIVRSARLYRPGATSWKTYALIAARMEMREALRRDASAGFADFPRSLRDKARNLRSIDDMTGDDLPSSAPSDADLSEGAEDILSRLKPRSRRVVEAIVLGGHQKAEVAKQLGITPTHANNIYKAAIEHLRESLCRHRRAGGETA